MNTIIDLAKKHLQDMPENSEVLKADLIKVINVAEQLEQQLKILNIPVVNGWLSFNDSMPAPGQLINYRIKTKVKKGKLTVADLKFCDWDNYEWKPV